MKTLPAYAVSGWIALALFSSLGWSDEMSPFSGPQLPTDVPVDALTTPRQYHSFLEFALGLSRFDYAENVPLPLKSTENGLLPILYVQYRSQKEPNAYFWALGGEYSPGGTNYDGSTQSGVPVQQGTSNSFFRAEADLGFNFFCLAHEPATACFKPYSGLGARLWTRGVSKVENGVASPSELYSWLYLPLGIRYEHQFSEKFSIAVDLSYRLMFLGQIKVRFSELDSGALDSNGNLGSKPGWRAELPVRYRISSDLLLSLTPWYEYSAIGQGDNFAIITTGKSGQGYEPESRTYQYGARAGLVYTY